MPEIIRALTSYFGYRSFRAHQEDVVRAVLAGRDSFTVMPTGGGKSLCYQLPAVLLSGVCVVVSPLIALMKDQVDAASSSGIRAAAFNSASSAEEKQRVHAGLRDEALDLLYVSPERLRGGAFLEYLKRQRVSFFAIDEAHCISAWGHDFRPDYLGLSGLVREFPGAALAAFTATATARVEEDIVTRLGLRDPLLTRASFNRPNLFYQVTPKGDLERQLLDVLAERRDESGIIYRTTRKHVESTAVFLRERGIAALAYHAGLSDAERAAAQDAFRRDECPVIVATIAFGMGIDKSNVRFVVHGDLPKNLEAYYQETGRAGRDGAPARCVLFYGRSDIARLMRFADNTEDPDARETAKRQLFQMLDFTQKEICRRRALLAYFGEELPPGNCGACDICTGEVEREDASVSAQKLLSAMVRTEGRFGARHVVNIVRGKETKLIRDCGHQHLPTFGVGRDQDDAYWHRVMDAALAQGLVAVPDPRFPTPKVTAAGWEVLRGQRPCCIVKQAGRSAGQKRAQTQESGPAFSVLREERTRLARLLDLPPYVIFSDKTLHEMARELPRSDEEFLRISGVGAHKLQSYGESFLALIQRWLQEHPEEEAALKARRTEESAVVTEKIRRTTVTRGDSARETGRLLDEGLSVADVGKARGLVPGTVLRHMEQLSATGKRYPAEQFMTPERLAWFRELFAATGSWMLGPVVELANTGKSAPEEQVDYVEARLARLLLEQEKKG